MTFDEILADCIQALEQGATIRECLTRYPAQATALEPLLQLVVSLSRESQTRLSAQAFRRGRARLATQAQQHHAHHRQPSAPTPSSRYAVQPAVYTQNGLPHHRQIRRLAIQKRTGGSLGMPRLLRTALLLLLLLGGTTFFRQVMTSLPGTTFYPVKSTGGQLVEVLMEAAGEGPSWHAMQAERRLQELAQLTNPDATTVQSLATVVETHWAAMLTASEGLPTTEREALLQTQITYLRQLEAAWTLPQADTPPPAVATVRKLIATGEAALSQPTDTPTAGVETATVAPTLLSTVAPTPTPLLQASATAALPVLVPSPTPTASPTPVATQVDLATPTVELPSPTAPISETPTTTPLPQITVQMPQQETNDQQADEDHKDTDKPTETATATATAPSEQPTATPTVSPTNLTTPDVEEGTATIAPTVITATPLPLTPVPTEAQLTPISATQTPQETATSENIPAVPTKTAPLATATAVPTSEPSATSTTRPTAQTTATRTPKPTATQASPPTATSDAADATAVPTTAVENTPAPTGQPTTPPRDEALQTPSSVAVTPVFSPPVKPRPTMPGGEPTKEVQP